MVDISKKLRMAELIKIINEASRNYYTGLNEESAINDSQFDKYLRELLFLEKETGIIFEGSPSLKVGYYEQENDKIKHEFPILSLNDTKSIDEMLHFLGDREGILSWKLDGVSLILYYEDGILKKGVTRGDGHYGQDVTENVILMRNVPKYINIKEHFIIRGEGVLALNEYDILKKTKEGEKYKNPRNMVSGLINIKKTSKILLNHMHFIAHSVILLEGINIKTRLEQLLYLDDLGFKVVPYVFVLNFELKSKIEHFTKEIINFEFPVDGLVLTYNDIQYGESLGATAKYPKHSLAFKWEDEVALTTVTGMKWSVSKTGLLTPVVIFKPVLLEGTEVKQANLHSLKIFKSLDIGIGDTIKVFKANKIIPEIEENLSRSGTEDIPTYCPVCNSPTKIVTTDKTEKLYCYKCKK